MADMTLQEFKEAADLGSTLWRENVDSRQDAIGRMVSDDTQILWGAVPIDGTSGVVTSIATHTANNFSYTSGIYGAPVPGSGDSSLTMHRFTMVFPDAQKSAKDIVPLIVQFQRCPIIPVMSQELVKDGITAVAQLQCNISTLDDTPGGIKLEFLCGEVDVALYASIITPGEDEDNTILDNANYSLWQITNLPLLKWFVYDFHNDDDPRFNSIKSDSGVSIRDMMDIIEAKLKIVGGVDDITFHMSHISEEYLNMFATFNEVMMAIVAFMDNPAAYISTSSRQPLDDLVDYIRNELAGRREYGAGDSVMSSMLNDVEDLIRNYFSLMVQSKNWTLSHRENEAFQNEVVRVLSSIMEMQSELTRSGDELSAFFDPVGGDSVCNSVSLQLVNQFKPLPLSNVATQVWQYLGPGRGGMTIELTTDESEIPTLGIVRNMFRDIAESVASVSEAASTPASLAFTRVITWPTVLANKLYFVPDTMATSTVPGFPTLRTVSLQFSLFDGDIVERSKSHKMFQNDLLEHMQVSAQSLETGQAGYGARDVRQQASQGIGSFYDLYLPWFVSNETIGNINSFPIELPTWGEVVSATTNDSYVNHNDYDDIVSIYRGTSINTSSTNTYSNNSSNTTYIPIDAGISGQGLIGTVMSAYAPPDFWCNHNNGDYVSRFTAGFEDTELTDYGSEESEDGAARIAEELGKPKMAWSKTSPYWVDWELKDHMEDEIYHSGKLSLTRAFPSAYFLFSSHATMGFGIFLQDMGWGYGMLEDMSVMQRGDIPVDTAVIRLVNLFGKLDDPLFGGGGLIGLFLSASFGDRLRLRDAISGGLNDTFAVDIRDFWTQGLANFAEGWRSTWQWTGQWPTHAEEMETELRKARSMTDTLPLAPGMWAHIRMGYGQPYQHATVFNGRISEYKAGEVVQITCESFGADLTKTIPASSSDKHNCEPRKDMCRLLNKPLSGIKGFIWNITQPGTGLTGSMGSDILAASTAYTASVNPAGIGGARITGTIANHMVSKGIPLWYATEGLGESIFTSQLAIQATGAEGGAQGRAGAGFGTTQPQLGDYQTISHSGREVALVDLIMGGSLEDPDIVGAQCEIGINMYNASPLADPGISQFGLGWTDNAEDPLSGNAVTSQRGQELLRKRAATHQTGAATLGSLADEVSFGYSYYGRSFVDYAQTCARLTGDYIFTVVPIANRCTIFYGKPDWPIWHELVPMGPQSYGDQSTVGDVIAVRRPFDQFALHGIADIIYNDITAQRDFATGVKPSWSRGQAGNMAEQTQGVFWNMTQDAIDPFWAEDGVFSQAPIQWFDADIHPSEKRVIQEDTQILKIVGGVAPEGTGAVVTTIAVAVGLIAGIVSGGGLIAAATVALLVTLAIKTVVWLIDLIWRGLELLTEFLLGVDIEDIFAMGDRVITDTTMSIFSKYDIPAGFLSTMKGVYWAQVNGVTKGILKEEVETMYRGSLYIVGNPVPRPHRSQFMMDTKSGMVGGFVADSVIHHFSAESGFVTEIIPKVKTTVWDVAGMAKWTINVSRVTRIINGFALGYVAAKYFGTLAAYSTTAGLGTVARGVPGVLDSMRRYLSRTKWTSAYEWLRGVRYGRGVFQAGAAGRELIGVSSGLLGRGAHAAATVARAAKYAKIAGRIVFIGFEATYSMFMAAWSETTRASRACYIAPLSKHGRPFVAGINGWRGSVITHGQTVNPSGDDLAALGQGAYGLFLSLFVGV